MKNALYYLIGFLSLCSQTTIAQTGISGEIKTEYIPFSNYVRPQDSLKTDSTSDFKRMQVSLEIPLSIQTDAEGKSKTWSLILDGSYARMSNRNYEESLFPTELLNAQIGFKHIRPLGKTWSLMAMGSVGVYTDLEQITSDDILVQGGVVFIKHFNPRLALGVGPILSNAFGVPMILPYIYFNWETQGKLRFRVYFPEGLEVAYKMNPNFDLKAVVELSGMTAEINRNDKSMLLGYQQVIAGIRPQFELGKNWTLQLTGGSSLMRSFKTSERKIKSIFKSSDVADPKFTSTFYGAVALKWHF